MEYPLNLSFKLIAVAPQIYVTDATGQTVCYVKQKIFKLKEAVEVFTDDSKQNLLCRINADRILDFSACYRFTDANGQPFGLIRRKGMRSIWRAHYEVNAEEGGGAGQVMISEDNAWVKVMDSLLGEIPILGFFTGFLFHPTYTAATANGEVVMRLKKQPAFFEGKFTIEKLCELDEVAELRMLMGYLMMLLLERTRG